MSRSAPSPALSPHPAAPAADPVQFRWLGDGKHLCERRKCIVSGGGGVRFDGGGCTAYGGCHTYGTGEEDADECFSDPCAGRGACLDSRTNTNASYNARTATNGELFVRILPNPAIIFVPCADPASNQRRSQTLGLSASAARAITARNAKLISTSVLRRTRAKTVAAAWSQPPPRPRRLPGPGALLE